MAATLTVGIAAPAVVTLGTTPLVAKAADQKYQNGTYDVQTSFKKQDDQNQDSLAQGFLNKGATLVVENGKLQLKITTTNDGGKYIKDMKVDGQTEYATIDHDGNNATITFTLPNTSGSYLIDMNLNTPMGAMRQKAYLKVDFSTVKTQATASSSSSSAASSASSASASAASSSSSSAKSATASSSATSSSTQASSTKASSNTSTTQPSSATNTDNAETRVLSIMKSSDPTQQSASAGFFAKQVTIKQDGNDYLITFTLSSGNGYIKSMTLNGEQPTAYTYKVSAAVLAKGSATLAFALQTPLGAMNETALAVFPGTGKSTSDVVNDAAKATTDEPVTLTSNGPVIDTTKEVQDVEYEVLNAAKSGVSEANAYYTHTARVTKSGSGYNVTLTVKVKSGIVSFTPLSVGAGPIVNTTKTSSGGDDIWTYTFYVADPTVLDNPVAASIRMSVPIANISNQTFSIWLVFGKTATNTRSYLDSLSGDGTSGGTLTSTGLTGSGSATPLAGSASPMATALQSGTGTVQNFDLAAAQKKLGKYAVKPGVSKMVEASLIKYPIAAALTFFIVAALIVIGVATTWRQRIVKKVRGLIHEA